MLTSLDAELFPDSCEVVEIPPHNQWVYLIYKNGNSGLRLLAQQHDWTIYSNNEIFLLDTIDVYVRDARQRYISGVNTYLQFLKQAQPSLDQNTVLWFVKQYSFLNRHYLPQFHWLANLARFTNPECVFRIRHFDSIDMISNIKSRAGIVPPDPDLSNKIMQDSKLELWFYLDQILTDLAGQNITWWQLIDHYKTNHGHAYGLVTNRARAQLDVLP